MRYLWNWINSDRTSCVRSAPRYGDVGTWHWQLLARGQHWWPRCCRVKDFLLIHRDRKKNTLELIKAVSLRQGNTWKVSNSVASAHSASAFPVEFLTQKQDPDSPLKREFSWVLGALADGQAHLYNQMLLISARYRCTEKTQTTELSSWFKKRNYI